MSATEAGRYVGTSVPRIDDPKLLRGEARFVDDIVLPDMVHAAIIRSPVAHAEVTSVDLAAAREEPGVELVLGPDEVAAATDPLPCVWLVPGQRQTRVPVASRQALYVGQPMGVVVAGSRAEAEDGVEMAWLDHDAHEVVTDAREALEPGAALLHPEWGTNICAELEAGDPRDTIEAVFASAAHVVRRQLRIQRVGGNPMETRGLIARWDPGLEHLTVWMSTQVPHHVRDHLAVALRLRVDQVRVIATSVGGGFGSKEHLYADEVMVCLAAIQMGRPVKWIEDRVEHMTASFHARDAYHDARLALDEGGNFLAIHTEVIGNLGAHPSNVGTGPFRISMTMLPGPYRFPVGGGSLRAVVTNTTPTGAYRGFGMQEATWVRERLVDEAARELGYDPVELRLRNMLTSQELPFTTPTFQEYDSGDYPEALRLVADRGALHDADDDGHIRRGIGFGSHVEFTGLGPTKMQKLVGFHLSGYESATVRMEPDGSVTVSSGVMGMGQGIETALAQVAADRLGVPIDRVRVRLGDTDVAPYSSAGSIASRSMTVGGGAVVHAAGLLQDKLRRIAAEDLEVAPDDLEVVDGRVQVRGDPTASIDTRELAERAWLGWDLPDGETPGLEISYALDPENISYSYATHAVAVAVDLETGRVTLEDYWVAHDSGVLVNPMICDGQVLGGIAQGVGIALLEEVTYGTNGQPLTTTYLDYLMPLSEDMPEVSIDHLCTPSPFIPGGMKGLGEGGTIPSPAAIANAVANAVPEIAPRLLQTPLSPERIWTYIAEAGLHDAR